jgi:hypothetical protein
MSERSLELLIKSYRGVGMTDEQVVAKLREQFVDEPSVGTAILKALGGHKQPKLNAVEKARGPLSNTVAGAVAGAMIRGGLVASVEKGYGKYGSAQEVAKARAQATLDATETGVQHDLTFRIRKAAEKAKS